MIRTAIDGCMKFHGIGKLDPILQSDVESYILTLDKVVLVEALASGIFSLRAMERSGHKFVVEDGRVSFFDGRLKFGATGNHYKHFAYKLTQGYVRDVMHEFSVFESGGTDGDSSMDEEIANPAVLTPT